MITQRRGQGYLELVIILPGLLLLTFLLWEFAYFWWARQVTATATFEAARQVAVGRPLAVGYATYDAVLQTAAFKKVTGRKRHILGQYARPAVERRRPLGRFAGSRWCSAHPQSAHAPVLPFHQEYLR